MKRAGKKLELLFAILVPLLALRSEVRGGTGHDDEHDTPSNPPPVANPRAPGKGSGEGRKGGCETTPPGLAESANNETEDFSSVVSYLTNPECVANSRSLGAAALSHGVKFNTYGGVDLDKLASKLKSSDTDQLRQIDIQLSKTVPGLLRQNPMSSKQLTAMIGQLAVLSPGAARSSLVTLIEQEIYSADVALAGAGNKAAKDQTVGELAKSLVKMGAGEPIIATEMAASVEDKALLAQADSLAKIFRALGPATSYEPTLAPAFNLSAGALTRGVQRGKGFYPVTDKANLLKTIFVAIQASLKGNENLENGSVELNEAYQSLAGGFPLKATALKEAWREAIRILSKTYTQKALATAVALSLREDSVYLPPEESYELVGAGKNYPELSSAVQNNFLKAWDRLSSNYLSQKIKREPFELTKKKFFDPLMDALLELGPERLDLRFLKAAWINGLIRDEDIEKRFPRFMLSFLDKKEAAMDKFSRGEGDLESSIALSAENFGVTWAITSLYAPALHEWVTKYEENEESSKNSSATETK